jgi:hypothetical protein
VKSGKNEQRGKSGKKTNQDALRRAVKWIINDKIFGDLKLHGNTKWVASQLVILAVFWVWSDNPSIVAAFSEAHQLVVRLFGGAAVSSYQGLTGALVTWTSTLLPCLWNRLHQLMERCDGKSWRVGLWVVLAVDGSRFGVPRTVANEIRFCSSKNKSKKRGKKKKKKGGGKKKNYKPQPICPQVWLTLIWHVGLRLPWCWEIGPSDSSERAHFLKMLAYKYPENTLFCGDAGFVGYEFWKTIDDANHHFLVRVGSNVRLLKKLGWYVRERDEIVYCWPNEAVRKKQPPLTLRLLHFKNSRGDVYLITNVLNEKKLSDRQAKEIYIRRWGIEVQFRSVKQTFMRGKLRSRTPDHALVELHWSLLGLWMIQLLAVKEQTRVGEPPENTSVAAALRVIRTIIRNVSDVPGPNEGLQAQLRNATKDNYERKSKKQSRNYPRRKEEPSAGPPKIRVASREEKRELQRVQELAMAP